MRLIPSMAAVADSPSRIAIITGAGQGIGRALALGFGASGYRVVAADLNEHNALDTAATLRAAGAESLGLSVDVGEPESITRMVESTMAEWGGLDVLVNNAGIFPRSTVVDMDLDTWTRTIDVNLRGTFLASQAAARVLIRQGRGGRIISVASVSAFEPGLRQAHYAASKAGIVAFSRNLALELAPHRITVNALAPGMVNTAQPRGSGLTEEQLAARGAAVPLGRMAEPDEMVPTVLFLCSPGADYITGQTLHVNGGSWMA
jgi:NAD(P)-dependent dehydrogenase (short-subunit alcohol dehydrogenase family)